LGSATTVSRAKSNDPLDPLDPPDPFEPFVLDAYARARASEAQRKLFE
jgi:hypothetical protein